MELALLTNRRDVLRITAFGALAVWPDDARPAGAAPAPPLDVSGAPPREVSGAPPGDPYLVLTPAEVEALQALGDTLAPGAAAAGLAQYVDRQLAADPADSLLLIRYLDVPAPHAPFYKAVLSALDGCSQARLGQAFSAVPKADAVAMVALMGSGGLQGWQGPPMQLAYFVLRSDAVDVVYGTEAGFAALGVPYEPHIPPPRTW